MNRRAAAAPPRPIERKADLKALTWHGKRDVRVDTVADPTIEHPTDAIIKVTSSDLCGSDVHLYEVLGPFLEEGDILGHEPMGIVQAVGPEVPNLAVGDVAGGQAELLRVTIDISAVDDVGEAVRELTDGRRVRRRCQPAEHAAALRQAADAEDGAGQRPALDRRHPAAAAGDDDPLGVDTFATHHVPLTDAPEAHKTFQNKDDGTFKVVFKP